MERSEDVSQEVSDLRAATESDSAVLELDLQGHIRHASDAWLLLAGLNPAQMIGQPIGAFVCPPDRDIFVRAADEMRDPKFTGGSVTIWASVHNPQRKHGPHVDIEAQGIIINQQVDAGRGNVMWLVSRYTPRPAVSLQLPHKLSRTTGFATDVFAAFLEQLAEAVRSHAPEMPAFPQELCRICERFIKTWWFERHHWLCSVEHKSEERVNAAQEEVQDHRDALIQMLSHPALAAKHAVRVSSPLARSTSKDSPPPQLAAAQLQQMIELCDRALELDLAEVKTNEKDPGGSVNAQIIAELKQRQSTPVNESLVAACDATNAVLKNILSAFERYSTFISYRRVLWAEVEEQVREAIDATVAAAESTTALVVIEASSAGSTDEDVPDHERRDPSSYPVLETDDEEEMRNVLGRKRGSRSYTKTRDSPRISPHLSPRLSPHLSPKLWPTTPSRRTPRDVGLGTSAFNVSVPIRRQSAASMLSNSAGSASSSIETEELPQPPSIRDYEIIKPISRGAYGVVYLARKRLTGEFFAIKVLRKSDMVAKNQVTHIKHERQILISTASSPYVATLFFTFQSRDFLYLVMEYVPGGDCAALLKNMGCLSEDWAKQYLAEIIVAVDSLHSQGILHRDLKPDNLLIDKRGHLKLSDFGLSATTSGHTQARSRSRTNSFGADYSPLTGSPSSPNSPSGTLSPISPFIDRHRGRRKGLLGTPDYLAPETIEGVEELTDAADWWAVGCIFFELVYGYPPFNDQTPQKVFANILKGKMLWPEIPAEVDISDASKELIKSFLILNPKERLGANGSDEVMNHPYFKDVDWSKLFEKPAPYAPEAANPIDTTNFDDRGALGMRLPSQETDLVYSLAVSSPARESSSSQLALINSSPGNSSPGSFHEYSSPCHASDDKGSPGMDDHTPRGLHSPITGSIPSISSLPPTVNTRQADTAVLDPSDPKSIDKGALHSRHSSDSGAPSAQRQRRDSRNSESSVDEFGSFTYRNIPVLEKANNEVITKIRTEERRLSVSSIGSSGGAALPALSSPLSELRPGSPMYAAPAPHAPIPRSPSFIGQPASATAATTSSGPSSLSSSSTSLAQQNEDAEKEAAVLRVRRRQQMRRSTVESGKLCYFPLNVLLGGTPNLASKFTKLGCRVIVCSNSNDVCLKANSAVHFDVIVLDLGPNESESDPWLTNKEICRVIRSTMNPNRETPILQVHNGEAEDPDLPAITVDDETELSNALRAYCNWEPAPQD